MSITIEQEYTISEVWVFRVTVFSLAKLYDWQQLIIHLVGLYANKVYTGKEETYYVFLIIFVIQK